MIKGIIKKGTKYLFVIILFASVIRIAQWIGQSQGANLLSPLFNLKTPKTIVIKEPLPVPKPMGKPSIIWRITHTRPQPRERGTGIYEPWMDDIYKAINFSMEKDNLIVWYSKYKDVKWVRIPVVPNKKYTWEGTKDGYNFYQDRFKLDWLKWNKLEVGGTYGLTGENILYMRTRLEIWRVSLSAGLNTGGLYGDVFVRLW